MEKNPKLAGRDYVILIDKSGSMGEKINGGKTRFQHAQEQTEAIAREAEAHDPDGIDVVVFNNKPTVYTGVTSDKVKEVFSKESPGGGTDTAAALKVVFDSYTSRVKGGNAKPMTIVVITDGEPNNREAVKTLIAEFSNTLTPDSTGEDTNDCGITFLQVGNDTGARNFLKELDDELVSKYGAKFDIVDTKNEDEQNDMSIQQILEEAVTD